jgi:cytochrome d ubiquinol oxidase subunit I
VATVAGWYVTEIGRQPWLVYGVLTTADAVTPVVPGNYVALTFAGYMITYVLLLGVYIRTIFWLAKKAGMPVDKGKAAAVFPLAPAE